MLEEKFANLFFAWLFKLQIVGQALQFPGNDQKSIFFSLKKMETDQCVVAGTKKKEEEEQWTEARLEKDPRKKVLRDVEKDKGCK